MDDLGLANPLALTPLESAWLDYFDGQHTLAEIQHQVLRRPGNSHVALEEIRRLVARLDAGIFLHSPRFEQIVNDPVRPPRCIGCYEAEPAALRRQLQGLFTHSQGAGQPIRRSPDGSLRGALIPHIDYSRGGVSYTHAFREIFEKSDASLFVIIGTSHYSTHRFTLTRKNFQTPLGILPVDQDYIDRLVQEYGDGLFHDEWLAHYPEHAIELQVVFLQYLYAGVRPIRIVPLVVGSFHDCIMTKEAPSSRRDIRSMIEALQRVETATPEPICYIISGDLAHIGPKFNPAQRLDERFLQQSLRQDQALLRHLQTVNTQGYYRLIAEEDDARSICGLPPTFATLEAAHPQTAKVLHYDRYIHPQGHESVSFASVGFYR